MSNLSGHYRPADCLASSCDALEMMIEPHEMDLGSFSVRRVLPAANKKSVGPWVFFDHMGPADFPPGQGINVRPHPHINLATVTYLFEGEVLHRDSLGNVQLIEPGAINLMVAGRGIVHSERERPAVHERAHRAHGLQLWLALPVQDEETDPAFYHYPADDIPTVTVDGVPLRIMMGTAFGVTSPVRVHSETLYIEAHLQPGQTFTLPPAAERAVYVAEGQLKARDQLLPACHMAVFTEQPGIMLQAIEPSRVALIGGDNLGERHLEWNFVSSRPARIEQAKRDWQAGRFAKVPGDEAEFIPLPD